MCRNSHKIVTKHWQSLRTVLRTGALLGTDISQIRILKMTIIRFYNKYVKASAALQPYVLQADKIATKRVENMNEKVWTTRTCLGSAFTSFNGFTSHQEFDRFPQTSFKHNWVPLSLCWDSRGTPRCLFQYRTRSDGKNITHRADNVMATKSFRRNPYVQQVHGRTDYGSASAWAGKRICTDAMTLRKYRR